jgi:peptidoglycan/LPS O-acetylase OafA/YrhL
MRAAVTADPLSIPLIAPQRTPGAESPAGGAAEAYRHDIDGLRALAVLAVVLFHATPWLRGGFVGVDVFFVISGFLITRRIAAELDASRFSLAAFWERRVRRIWPAALVVTAVVLVAGWILLVPKDYAALAEDAGAQALMLVNVHFWRNLPRGYFAPASDLRPLLHMWSLAVEEQFYVLLPLVMIACWRFGRAGCTWLLGLLALASFGCSVFWLPSQPNAVFYLLPFRAWELLVGSLAALVAPRLAGGSSGQSAAPATAPGFAPARLGADAVGLAGLALMGGCCFSYTQTTPFPALAAVPPCLGAALVILGHRAGTSGTSPSVRLLSLWPLPAIGRLSYSLYLWHWPVLAFLRCCLPAPRPDWQVAAMAAVLPVAYVSWRWVEQPFRTRDGTPPEQDLAAASGLRAWRPVFVGVGVWLVVLAAGWGIVRLEGVPARFTEEQRRFLDTTKYVDNDYKARASFRKRYALLERPLPDVRQIDALPRMGADPVRARPDFLLWGDSHGVAISDEVDRVARLHGLSGHAALLGGTPPLLGVATGQTTRDRQLCETWSRHILDWVREHHPRVILLCANWPTYRNARRLDADGRRFSGSGEVYRYALQILVRECEKVGTHVNVMLQVPEQEKLPQHRAVAARLSGREISLDGVDRATADRQQAEIVAGVAGVGSDRCVAVDLAAPLFGPDGMSRVGDAGGSWYSDRNHISAYGAGRLFAPLLDTMMAALAAEAGDEGPAGPSP